MSAGEARQSSERFQTRTGDSHHLDDVESNDALPILPEPKLPDLDLPQSELDLTMTFDSIFADMANKATEPEAKMQKRASNVLKLSQENETLKEQLRAMTERLEAAERKQRELEASRNHSTNAAS